MKLDILRTQYRTAPPQCYWALNDAAAKAQQAGWDLSIPKLFGSASADWARDIAIQRVRPDADYVLFVDDDMAPDPDSIVRLLRHQVPAVSAICTTKEIPIHLAASAWDRERDAFAPLEAANDTLAGKLVSGDFVAGAAFLLVQKAVLDAVVEYHLSGRDWLDHHRKMLDRLHVRAESREKERQRLEKLRRELHRDTNLLKVFSFSVQDNECKLGEDFAFCRSILRLGYPVAIDTGCIVSHVGDFPYSVRLLGAGDAKDVRIG